METSNQHASIRTTNMNEDSNGFSCQTPGLEGGVRISIQDSSFELIPGCIIYHAICDDIPTEVEDWQDPLIMVTNVRIASWNGTGPLGWEKNPTRQPYNQDEEGNDADIDSDAAAYFTFDFIHSKGNEYFCDIDEEYLTDRFNLTSLNTEVQYYQHALELVTDVFDLDCDDDVREQIEKSARHLYGLVHARYIITSRGLQKMCEKYKNGDFGKCPRVACEGQPLLPMGQNDNANLSTVKLYCARCEDLYNPKSSRHASVDGAYFGTSFHNMFFQVYPHLLPPKSQKRYEPRIFGFRVHASAALARWQGEQRDKMKGRLREEGMDTGFEAEEQEEEMEDSVEEEDDVNQRDGIDDMFEGARLTNHAR